MTKQEKLTRRFNAYNEVYIILNHLEEEEYKKIPERITNAIEFYRNKAHKYEINEELDLKEQEMLPEAKAILFNIFRDYLSTDEQRAMIIRMQNEDLERIKREKNKGNKQYKRIFEEEKNNELKNDILNKKELKEKALISVEKDNFIKQIIRKIKSFFHN